MEYLIKLSEELQIAISALLINVKTEAHRGRIIITKCESAIRYKTLMVINADLTYLKADHDDHINLDTLEGIVKDVFARQD